MKLNRKSLQYFEHEHFSDKFASHGLFCPPPRGRTQGGGEGSLAPPPRVIFLGGGGRRPPPKIFKDFFPLKDMVFFLNVYFIRSYILH